MVLMDTKPEYGDYIGEGRLLCCSVCQCHMPKEAYFSEGQALFGHDRHPSECECRRKEREKRQSEERRREHEAEVERLKASGFTDSSMKKWIFDNDNGRNPQMRFAMCTPVCCSEIHLRKEQAQKNMEYLKEMLK